MKICFPQNGDCMSSALAIIPDFDADERHPTSLSPL
jgi:hypothetical protein